MDSANISLLEMFRSDWVRSSLEYDQYIWLEKCEMTFHENNLKVQRKVLTDKQFTWVQFWGTLVLV